MYVDGFIVPVPKKKTQAYVKLAKLASKIWMDHGALSYVEATADDAPVGKLTSFPRSIKLKPTEAVWFSWITYKSRKHRDQVMAKVMADPRMAPYMNPGKMPFDGKRMIWGGFKAVVKA